MFSTSIPEVYLNDVSPDVFGAVVAFVYQDDTLVSALGFTTLLRLHSYREQKHTVRTEYRAKQLAGPRYARRAWLCLAGVNRNLCSRAQFFSGREKSEF